MPDLLYRALTETPEIPFYQAAPLRVWLEQGPRKPVAPHTPAWNNVLSGKVSPRDAVALIIGLWVDASITQHPQHLSWLTNHIAIYHTTPPIIFWPYLRKLAAMPIGEWPQEGRRLWMRIMKARESKWFPWQLDKIFREAARGGKGRFSASRGGAYWQWNEEPEANFDDDFDDGLDQHPGNSRFTAYGVWRVAMGHIKKRIGEEAYRTWVAECDAVYYADEELYICAIDRETVNVLESRYREVIEEAVSGVAQIPLRVRFVEENVPAEDEPRPNDGVGGKEPPALSAPDSSRSAHRQFVASKV